ncbi:MAG TPA: hypothetical protein VFQ17_04840 [Nocardioides sp.]|nr:hypothetical protein [Nocardioides sp.]
MTITSRHRQCRRSSPPRECGRGDDEDRLLGEPAGLFEDPGGHEGVQVQGVLVIRRDLATAHDDAGRRPYPRGLLVRQARMDDDLRHSGR